MPDSEFRYTSARIKVSIVYSSPFVFHGSLSSAERSTIVAELSRGTAHVDGSEVIVVIVSTVSFDMSFIGPDSEDFAFPFEVFLMPAEEPDRNRISGEIEREPEIIRP